MFFTSVMRRVRLKLLNKAKDIKKYKRILAVLAIVLLTAFIEIIFNFQSIIGGYDWMDVTEHMKLEEEGEYEKYVIDFTTDKALYIKQIRLVGEFASDDAYVMEVQKLNGFGKSEKVSYWDNVSTWFSESYTNLNKKVKSIKITLYKPEKTELHSVAFSNRFEINKYRVLFVVCLLALLYVMIFEKKFVQKVEWYFLCFSLVFGLLVIIYAQPTYNAWDEEVHFQNVYSIASGKHVKWSEATQAIIDKKTPSCNTKAEYAELRAVMNEKGREVLHLETKETGVVSNSFLAYIPMAIMMKIGMLLNFSFSNMYMLGKIGNLLFYVAIMFLAIRLAKKKKLFLVFIAMMPTSIYLAASYSYDAVVFACVTLGSVLWCNEMFYSQKKYQAVNMISSIFLFSVGCLSKAVYIPLILVMLLLPRVQKMKKNIRLYFGLEY